MKTKKDLYKWIADTINGKTISGDGRTFRVVCATVTPLGFLIPFCIDEDGYVFDSTNSLLTNYGDSHYVPEEYKHLLYGKTIFAIITANGIVFNEVPL